jgi:anti-sigma factor RsiW
VTVHLTEEQIHGFRLLDADTLFAVENHLASCQQCRNRLAEIENKKDRSATVDSYLQQSEPDHLLFEQLQAYIDDEMDETDQEIIESHLSLCSQCREDVADLQKTSLELTSRQIKKPSFGNQVLFLWRSPQYSAAFKAVSLAAAAAFVALLAGLIFRASTNDYQEKLNEAQQQNQKLQEKVRELEIRNKNLQQRATQTNSKPLLLSLLDGKERIEMDQTGNIYGTGSYPKEYRDRIQEVIAKGQLQNPGWLNDLGSSSATRGETNPDKKHFAVLAPVGIVVESDRPTFQWSAQKDALKYHVKIYDGRFQLVAESPELETLNWVASKSLERGKFYTWKVDAITKTETISAPVLPAPEAKFKILEEEKLKELEQIRALAPDSHLLKAVAYTEAGLVEEAAKELEELRKANPDSLFVKKLSPK